MWSSEEIFELNGSNWTVIDNWSDLWQIDFGQFYSLECPSIPIVLLKSYILLAQVEILLALKRGIWKTDKQSFWDFQQLNDKKK